MLRVYERENIHLLIVYLFKVTHIHTYFFLYLLLFNLYFTICPAGHSVNFSNLIAK